MAFPPDPIQDDVTNDTAIPDLHPALHNALAAGLNDTVAELVDFEDATALALAGKSATGHSHAIGDTTGLQAALDAKAAAADLTAHTGDTSDAHDASAISVADAGGYFTGTEVEAVLQELGADVAAAAQTPWASNIDADGFTLTDALQVGVNVAGTTSNGGTVKAFTVTGQRNFDTSAGGSFFGVDATPTLVSTVNLANAIGLRFDPTMTGSVTVTTLDGVQAKARAGLGLTATTARSLYGLVHSSLATITTGIGLDIESTTSSGTLTTMIGLRITQLAAGSTKWGMQVGDYQSYHEGDLRVGAVSAGSTASPAAKLEVVEPTIGDRVARFTSVATNDDPVEDIVQARVQTTTNAQTTLHAITVPTSTTMMVVSHVTARRTGGSAGAAEDGASYIHIATFKNTAGTVAQIGSTSTPHTAESQAGWDCVFDVTGATARIRVTGATNNDVTWHATSHLFQVAS